MAGKLPAEIDLWRSANIMIQQHGAQAALEAGLLADAMLEKGDPDGQRVWLQIRAKIKELQHETPAEGKPVH